MIELKSSSRTRIEKSVNGIDQSGTMNNDARWISLMGNDEYENWTLANCPPLDSKLESHQSDYLSLDVLYKLWGNFKNNRDI